MTDEEVLSRSRALWNRTGLDLTSMEVLAQILDRGEMNDWRALYALASRDVDLRRRIYEVIRAVALPLPFFWLAALASLGEAVDYELHLPEPVDI